MAEQEITEGETTTAVGERSIWQNLWDVIAEPSATFEDVAERPRWLAPLLVMAAATLAVSILMMPMWAELQQMRLAEMPADQREQAAAGMEMFKYIGLVFVIIAFVVITALLALLVYGWAAISGGRNARYKVAFTALIYSGVIGFIQLVLQAVVILVKGPEQVAREGGPPLFGLSLFLEREDMPSLLWGQLANINFFSIWYAIVIGIAGVHALRMSKGSATAMAVVMFLIWGVLTSFQGMG